MHYNIELQSLIPVSKFYLFIFKSNLIRSFNKWRYMAANDVFDYPQLLYIYMYCNNS